MLLITNIDIFVSSHLFSDDFRLLFVENLQKARLCQQYVLDGSSQILSLKVNKFFFPNKIWTINAQDVDQEWFENRK